MPRQGETGHQATAALDHLLERAFDLETFETRLITRAVERAYGNLARAAKALGITRPQLAYRYKKQMSAETLDCTESLLSGQKKVCT